MCENKFKCPGHEFVECADSPGLLHCKHCPQEWIPKPELDFTAIGNALQPFLGRMSVDGKPVTAEGLLPFIGQFLPFLLKL